MQPTPRARSEPDKHDPIDSSPTPRVPSLVSDISSLKSCVELGEGSLGLNKNLFLAVVRLVSSLTPRSRVQNSVSRTPAVLEPF